MAVRWVEGNVLARTWSYDKSWGPRPGVLNLEFAIHVPSDYDADEDAPSITEGSMITVDIAGRIITAKVSEVRYGTSESEGDRITKVTAQDYQIELRGHFTRGMWNRRVEAEISDRGETPVYYENISYANWATREVERWQSRTSVYEIVESIFAHLPCADGENAEWKVEYADEDTKNWAKGQYVDMLDWMKYKRVDAALSEVLDAAGMTYAYINDWTGGDEQTFHIVTIARLLDYELTPAGDLIRTENARRHTFRPDRVRVVGDANVYEYQDYSAVPLWNRNYDWAWSLVQRGDIEDYYGVTESFFRDATVPRAGRAFPNDIGIPAGSPLLEGDWGDADHSGMNVEDYLDEVVYKKYGIARDSDIRNYEGFYHRLTSSPTYYSAMKVVGEKIIPIKTSTRGYGIISELRSDYRIESEQFAIFFNSVTVSHLCKNSEEFFYEEVPGAQGEVHINPNSPPDAATVEITFAVGQETFERIYPEQEEAEDDDARERFPMSSVETVHYIRNVFLQRRMFWDEDEDEWEYLPTTPETDWNNEALDFAEEQANKIINAWPFDLSGQLTYVDKPGFELSREWGGVRTNFSEAGIVTTLQQSNAPPRHRGVASQREIARIIQRKRPDEPGMTNEEYEAERARHTKEIALGGGGGHPSKSRTETRSIGDIRSILGRGDNVVRAINYDEAQHKMREIVSSAGVDSNGIQRVEQPTADSDAKFLGAIVDPGFGRSETFIPKVGVNTKGAWCKLKPSEISSAQKGNQVGTVANQSYLSTEQTGAGVVMAVDVAGVGVLVKFGAAVGAGGVFLEWRA